MPRERQGADAVFPDAGRLEQRHPLASRVADRVGDLALIGPEPNRAGQRGDALGEDKFALDPFAQTKARRRDERAQRIGADLGERHIS
jgi:hypothetical protein